jgi:SPP1 family predicted phage head-tail adaptor
LQARTDTVDAYGASVPGWTTQATVYGGIEPLSGREYFAARTANAETRVRVVIRYYAGLDASWRVVSGGKTYTIENVINENERDRMLTLMCLEGVKAE